VQQFFRDEVWTDRVQRQQQVLGHDLHPSCFCSCEPALACPASATVECTKGGTYPPNDDTSVGLAHVDGESCEPFQSTVLYGDESQLPEDAVGLPTAIARTYTADLECDGLPADRRALSCRRTIQVKDTTPPTLIGVPTDTSIAIPCEDPVPPPPIVTAVDACGTVSLGYQEANGTRRCPRQMYRTWKATETQRKHSAGAAGSQPCRPHSAVHQSGTHRD
jgi:hypothetical protein